MIHFAKQVGLHKKEFNSAHPPQSPVSKCMHLSLPCNMTLRLASCENPVPLFDTTTRCVKDA